MSCKLKHKTTQSIATNRLSFILLTVVAIGLVSSVARASSVGADFSSNGGDGWSYGYYANLQLDPTQFVAFNTYIPSPGVAGFNGLDEWKAVPTPLGNTSGGSDPNVIYNHSGSDIVASAFGSIDFQSGTVNLGPFFGPTVIRYTASHAGLYDLSASFETVQVGNTAPTAYVFFGNNIIPSKTQLLSDPGNAQIGDVYTPFNNTSVALTEGETVDFVVFGNNSNNKTTELSASIAVPLPAAGAIGFGLLGGFGSLAVLRKQLRRTHRVPNLA